jgi:hypothetical protein
VQLGQHRLHRLSDGRRGASAAGPGRRRVVCRKGRSKARGSIRDRFNGGREGTLWYYRALARCFRETVLDPLAAELDQAVAAMAAEAR